MADSKTEAAAGISRVLTKIQGHIERGGYYEAHEMLKTVFHRSKSKGDVDKAYDLLVEGIRLQLQKGQLNCAQEEALLLLESYCKDKVPCEGGAWARVQAVLEAFPPASTARGEESTGPPSSSAPSDDLPSPLRQYKAVAMEAIKWAKRSGGRREVDQLHCRLGTYLWEGGNLRLLAQAAQHLAKACEGQKLGAIVAVAASKGKESERDLFLLRGILQLLAAAPSPKMQRNVIIIEGSELARRIAAAEDLFEFYCRKIDVPDTPLFNFVKLYIEALHHQSRSLTALLVQKYRPSLDRDEETFLPLLHRIDHALLGAPPPSNGFGGIFADVMKMFIGGDDE